MINVHVLSELNRTRKKNVGARVMRLQMGLEQLSLQYFHAWQNGYTVDSLYLLKNKELG